jgi:hypothetical protein
MEGAICLCINVKNVNAYFSLTEEFQFVVSKSVISLEIF